MSKIFKLVIVGYGGMGGWHHANIKEKIPQIDVVGAYDVRPEALELAVSNGLKAYESLEEVLSDPTIDIITVATPNDFHKGIAIAALESGKNVVCEKPVALNSEEVEEIIAVAEKTGKLFTVHQNRRWDKDYLTIKKIVSENTIGAPYFIESKVTGSRRALHGWRGHKLNGGGMLLDWGVHLIDQLMNLTDRKVVEVSAQLFAVYCDKVDDNMRVNLRFEDNLVATVEVSTNCFINPPRWHMSCKDGTVRIDDWDVNGKMIKLNTDAVMAWDNDIVYTSAGPTRTMAPRPSETTTEIELPIVEADWTNYYKNIVGVLLGTEKLIVTPQQALRVMKVIDYAFISEKIGQSIKCCL